MRVIHGVILLGAVAAGCATSGQSTHDDPSPSPVCEESPGPPDVPVMIKLAFNPKSEKCEPLAASPNPAVVCKYTKTITWTFANTCEQAVSASIGDRQSLDATNHDDPVVAASPHSSLPSSPSPVPASSEGVPGTAVVKASVSGAQDGCYKYDTVIAGKTFDPEIEVRRGRTVGNLCSSPSPSSHP